MLLYCLGDSDVGYIEVYLLTDKFDDFEYLSVIQGAKALRKNGYIDVRALRDYDYEITCEYNSNFESFQIIDIEPIEDSYAKNVSRAMAMREKWNGKNKVEENSNIIISIKDFAGGLPKEVADKLSDYANAEKETILKNIRNCSIMGTIALAVYSVLELTGLVLQNMIFEKIAGYCETLALVTVIIIMLHTTGLICKIPKKKSNDKPATL